MSAKIRIEYIRPRRAGDSNGALGEGVLAFYGAEVLTLSPASTASAAAPAFASDQGLTGGVFARVTGLVGASIVTPAAANPVATQLNGVRIDQGDIKFFPIETGQKLAAIEAADGVVGGIKPVSSAALEAAKVLKNGPADIRSVHCLPIGVDGYLMLFDGDAPADGAVTPVDVTPVFGGVGATLEYRAAALHFDTKATAVFSTTGPFVKTASASAFFAAQVV